MSKQLAETIDSLVRQFRGLPQRVDFSTNYRTRLPSRKVEIVAKHLDHVGDVFRADDLRKAYQRLHEAVFAKPVDSASLKLTDLEERRLAAMNDEDRQSAREYLGSLGGVEALQRDLQRTADRAVEVLEEVKEKVAGLAGGKQNGGERPADANASWCHSPNVPRPREFYLGPLTGTGKALDTAICKRTKPDPHFRQLKRKGHEGRLWIVERTRSCFEVWFSDEGSYRTARSWIDATAKAAESAAKKPHAKTSRRRK